MLADPAFRRPRTPSSAALSRVAAAAKQVLMSLGADVARFRGSVGRGLWFGLDRRGFGEMKTEAVMQFRRRLRDWNREALIQVRWQSPESQQGLLQARQGSDV